MTDLLKEIDELKTKAFQEKNKLKQLNKIYES